MLRRVVKECNGDKAVSYRFPRVHDVLSLPMDLLQEPPAGFDGIAKAFAMAKHLPSTSKLNVKIGLVRDDRLFATGILDGYRQVNFFSEHVRDLGWHERLLGSGDDMHGCDMLFVHPAQAAGDEQDPSFIRRPAVELWPARGSHAES